MSGINIPELKRHYSTDSSYADQKALDIKADSSWEPGTLLTDGFTSRRVYVTDEEKKLLNMSEKEAKSRLKEAKRRARENMNKTLKQNIEEFMKNPKAKNKTKKKGGKKKRSYKRRKRKTRRRSRKRGGMFKSIQPGLMQNFYGALDPHDALKVHLIKPKNLPKEMKLFGKSIDADKFNGQLIKNLNDLKKFQNYIKKRERERRQLEESGSNKEHIDGIKREINNLKGITDDIKRANYFITKHLEGLTESTKKVVNPGKVYRRFEGGKKRKTRNKKKRRKKKTKKKK